MNIKDRLPLDDIEPTNNELLNLIPSIATIGEFEVEILELLQLTTNKTTIKPENKYIAQKKSEVSNETPAVDTASKLIKPP